MRFIQAYNCHSSLGQLCVKESNYYVHRERRYDIQCYRSIIRISRLENHAET